MKLVINKFERDLLLAHPETEIMARELLLGSESLLSGSPEQYDTLREACADLLQRIGFDAGYEATIEGQALEVLIDKLLR